MRIICVGGARPNFMKVKPVVDALEARGAEVVLVHTGQHYDASMSGVFFDELGLRRPDHHLGAGSGTQAEQIARVMTSFEMLMTDQQPDLVVVVGDVNSTLACALVTANSEARLAHVEAGLRSGDRRMPEEINREVTDLLSDYLFATEPDAVENLTREGRRSDTVHLVGNVMIDSLLANLERARASDIVGRLGLSSKMFVLVTLHRPSNVDKPAILSGLMSALDEIANEIEVVLPMHPRLREALAPHAPSKVRTIDPLGYLDFIALEDAAALCLTDSGGVQEETMVLGTPCLTLRTSTERPITITYGTNRLVGIDPEDIVSAARETLAHPPQGKTPDLWDGKAAERIAAILVPD